MATSEPVTESQLRIMGKDALAYARDCLTDPWKLSLIFNGRASYDPDARCISAPPLHEIFSGLKGNDDATEFVDSMTKTGFSVFCTFDATFIEWPATPAFKPMMPHYLTAKEASSYSLDCRAPIVDKCIKEVMTLIRAECEGYKFSLTTPILLQYPKDVYVEAIIFLENYGYKVSNHYLAGRECFESYHWGHKISWDQGKFVRDVRPVSFWEKLWRKSQ